MDQLKEVAPNTKLVYDERWVDNGRIITSAGVSAGVDTSLYVVSKLLGKKVAGRRRVICSMIIGGLGVSSWYRLEGMGMGNRV